jgi:hypothetical protein
MPDSSSHDGQRQDRERVLSRTDAIAKALLPDELWSLIAAHLPAHVPSPKGGRPRINDRAALTGNWNTLGVSAA